MKKFSKKLAVPLALTLLTANLFSGISFAASETENNNTTSTATNCNFSEVTSASINYSGDIDYYRITPPNSGAYNIETSGTTPIHGYLYDANTLEQIDISNNDYNPSNNFILKEKLEANHSYYLKVAHKETAGTGSYSFKISPVSYKYDEIEPNNDISKSYKLPNYPGVEPFTASIEKIGDQDYYELNFGFSGTYEIETLGGLDTNGYLFDSNKALFTSDYDNGIGNNFKITSYLTGRKTYYLKVNSSSGTGDYQLKIKIPDTVSATDTEGSSFNNAIYLPGNIVNSGGKSINTWQDEDYFKFIPQTDGMYIFETTGYLNTIGYLYNSNFSLLGTDDESGDGNNARVQAKLTANQTYYFKVKAVNEATGTYGVRIARGKILPVNKFSQQPYDVLCWASSSSMIVSYFKGDSVDRIVPMAQSRALSDLNHSYLESYSYFNKMKSLFGNDFYKYPSVYNKKEYLTNCEAVIKEYIENPNCTLHGDLFQGGDALYSFNALCQNIDNNYPIMRSVLLTEKYGAPAHVEVVTGYIEDTNGMNVVFNDPWDGKQYISIDQSNTVGAYMTFIPDNQEFEPNNTVDAAIKVTQNQINGKIDKPGDIDVYKFNADFAKSYEIKTTGTTDTVGDLCDSYGNTILTMDIGGDGGNFKINYSLKPMSTYFIKVRHQNGSATGNYTLNITPVI